MKRKKSESAIIFISMFVLAILIWFVSRNLAGRLSHDVVATNGVTSELYAMPPAPNFSVMSDLGGVTAALPDITELVGLSLSQVDWHRENSLPSETSSSISTFLWGVYPYLCILLFFLVPIIRMVTRPYSWSTRASGLFGRQLLGFASTIFHWGLVLLLVGHVAGLVGGVMGSASAIDFFFWSGLIGGILVLVGSSLALYRRIKSPMVRAMSRPEDYIVQCFLIAIVAIALYQVVNHRIFGVAYTASSWTASLWTLSPQPELMASASFLTKLHIFLALLFFAYFPFTKLVHFWTFPVNYFVRVPQSMRTQKYRFQRRWEFALRSDKSWLTYGLLFVAAGFLITGSLLGSPNRMNTDGIPSQIETTDGTLLAGYPLYISQCARCHGIDGYGDGPGMDSSTFSALPRSFVYTKEHQGAAYHFVSTENGIASDDDLYKSITEGLEGSGMPAFPDLTSDQVISLVDVLNTFREDGVSAGKAIVIPTEPSSSTANIARGKQLYAINCASCHGDDGSGGLQEIYSWRELAPERPQQIFAADLSLGEVKMGKSAEDIYTRITCGIPGGYGGAKLMMSFETMPIEDRWAIVQYVLEEILPETK